MTAITNGLAGVYAPTPNPRMTPGQLFIILGLLALALAAAGAILKGVL